LIKKQKLRVVAVVAIAVVVVVVNQSINQSFICIRQQRSIV